MIWRRYIEAGDGIKFDQDWEVVLLQAVERLREMRHAVVHHPPPVRGPIMLQLVIHLPRGVE